LFEVDTNKNIVWEYINPVTNTGVTAQGQAITRGNGVFRAYRYAATYPGLMGKNLTPTPPIELNPNTSHCMIYTNHQQIEAVEESQLSIYPNPTSSFLNVKVAPQLVGQQMMVATMKGEILIVKKIDEATTQLDLSTLSPAVYLIGVGGARQLFVKY